MSYSPKIYMFDNSTGVDIPRNIDVYQVELLLGAIVSEIHNRITPCKLFCVFTPISEADIIVQSESDRELMSSTLQFGKRNYTVIAKESSIWYSDKAKKNIIISNTVQLPASELASLLRLYLNEVDIKTRNDEKNKKIEIYTVINTRRNVVLEKTPDLREAVLLCDKNPCCIIINREQEEIYRSAYGHKPIPYKHKNHTTRYKLRQKQDPDTFRLQLR